MVVHKPDTDGKLYLSPLLQEPLVVLYELANLVAELEGQALQAARLSPIHRGDFFWLFFVCTGASL